MLRVHFARCVYKINCQFKKILILSPVVKSNHSKTPSTSKIAKYLRSCASINNEVIIDSKDATGDETESSCFQHCL